MRGDKALFKSLKEKVGDYLTFGDGSHAQALGKGTIEISGLPLLKDFLYIKGLKANLLRITQICDEDFLVQFSKCPNLKPLWGSQNSERWRRPFVVLIKWESKQRQIIKR